MPKQEVKAGMNWQRKRGWVLIADAPLWLDEPTFLDILRPPAQGWRPLQGTDPPHGSLIKKMPLKVCLLAGIFSAVIPSSQRTQACMEFTNQLTRTPSSTAWCWEECLSKGFLPFSLVYSLVVFPSHTAPGFHSPSSVECTLSFHVPGSSAPFMPTNGREQFYHGGKSENTTKNQNYSLIWSRSLPPCDTWVLKYSLFTEVLWTLKGWSRPCAQWKRMSFSTIMDYQE